jgi:class 3 adenylate cyclase/tetratricopeptide (TPR) repeat protein
LRSIGLSEYTDAFARHHIDAAVLPTLTAGDLRKLGVASVGHCKKLLAAIAEFRRDATEPRLIAGIAPAVPSEGERRQVTVLFADLSGHTRLTSELDAEELHELMFRFFGAVDHEVESYGGTVDEHTGDCVMAVFGAPVAHGNDCERAVRAALAIHKVALPAVSEAAGRQLRAHVGIATGQVVVSHKSGPGQTFALTGQSVNLASRLADAAEPGATLISKPVWQTVSNLVIAEGRGEVAVKGLECPIAAWRVLGLRNTTAEPSQRFVGRRAELSQFQAVVAGCLETAAGLAVYVRGHAGIGKTRLVEEFRLLAKSQGFACHSGVVLDFGVGEGRDAIGAIACSLLGLSPGADAKARGAAAVRAVAEGQPLAADQGIFLNDLLHLPQPSDLRLLYDAMDDTVRTRGRREVMAEMVRRAAGRQPLMLVVENLHWADGNTLQHLAELTATITECTAVLVMTSRIEGDPIDEAWRGAARGSPLLTMDLGPLRRQEAMALAGSAIETMPQLALACVERAEGNPLFLEHLLRVSEETAPSMLPGSIQSLVLARVDQLDPIDKQALQAASILGQRFTLDALRRLLGDPGYTCKGLIKHYLVRPNDADFVFAHALVWEGVYASLLQARRRDLHRQAAEWFAASDPIRAEHLDRGEDAGAARAYLDAALGQVAAYRPGRAIELVERGLAVATERGDVCALSCLQGHIQRDLGSTASSIEAYRRALEFASGDAERCEAWLGIAAGMRVLDQFDEAFAVLEQAESAAHHLASVSALARAHYLRGSLYFPLGNIEGCFREHEQALQNAQQAGSVELEARALSGLGDASSMRARIKTAHQYFDRCIQLARAHGFGRLEVANRHMRGIMRYYQNDLRGAIDDTLAAAAAAAAVGQQRAEMVARAASGYILPDAGELEQAKQQCELALKLARRLGARRFEASSLRHLARIIAALGEPADAVTLLEQAYAISCDSGVTFSGPWVLGALAIVTADPGTRRWALEEGETILARGCVFHNYFWFYRDAIEVSLSTEDWDAVERYASALEHFTHAEPVPWTSFFVARGRALAAHGRGLRGRATLQKLRHLRAEADRAGFKTISFVLEQALATV